MGRSRNARNSRWLKVPIKPKKCKVCKAEFTPARPLQSVCGFECGLIHARKMGAAKSKKTAQIERKTIKEAKDRLKSRSDYIREAQTAFNAYIRARDEKEPCISCGRHHQGQYHAGHYRTTKAAPELRFCEINVWKQCSVCNNHLSGNILEYRINLIKRGINVDWIEGPHESKKYTIPELLEIKTLYKQKLKDLKNS